MSATHDPDGRALFFDEAVSVTDHPASCEAWRDAFAASADWLDDAGVAVPRDAELQALCVSFGFPPIAIELLAEHRGEWDEPRIRRLGAHVQWMISHRYTPVGYFQLGWPRVFSRAPLFYAYAALGLARRTAAEQAARGIEPAVTAATLRDIGQQVYLHRRIHRDVGMNKGWWLCHHLTHHLFRLGRLQFQRAFSSRDLGPIPAGAPFLDVHIPEGGALAADTCNASFAESRAFFAEHFAADEPRFYACTSWLLDPELAGLLPGDSNIARFQHRFTLATLIDGPSSVFEFAFDRPDLDGQANRDLASLPRDSRLRCALLDHYAAGGRIRMGVGTIRIR